MSRALAILELFVAASLWGFGFIAAIWAMQRLSPFELTFLRFFLASLLAVPWLLTRSGRSKLRAVASLSFVPGVLFAGTLIVQTWGLQYTTATKSGFITTLYVVFVPLLESLLGRRALGAGLWGCVALAFLGTGMIVNVGLNALNIGDALTFVCALFATGQIYVMGQVSPRVRTPFLFNSMQAFWAAVLCSPFAFQVDFWTRLSEFATWPITARLGVLSLAFGSTVIAFSLQVRAQARLSATVSSLLFLLESPFAMVFAIYFLAERLGPLELSGAVIIFIAAVLASVLEGRRARETVRAPLPDAV